MPRRAYRAVAVLKQTLRENSVFLADAVTFPRVVPLVSLVPLTKSTTSLVHAHAKSAVLEAKSIPQPSIPTQSAVSALLVTFPPTSINASLVPTEPLLSLMEPLNASAANAAGNQTRTALIVSNVNPVFTRPTDQLVSLVPSTRSPPDTVPANASLAVPVMVLILSVPTQSALLAALVVIPQEAAVSNVPMEL